MSKVLYRLATFFREDLGQDLVEYTLLIGFLALAAVAVLSQVGVTIQGPWSTVTNTLAMAGGTTPPAAVPAPPVTGSGDGDGDGH